MAEKVGDILWGSWLVLGQMAPYLLLGFLVAGVLSVCISPAWVERHLGRRGLGPVVKASLFGVPLPLCSCGVIPVAASIHRHGASRSATTAFLLSTPQTGVDSIAVTYAMLGPVLAIYRPVAALLTGLIGGGLVQLFDPSDAAGKTGGKEGSKPGDGTKPCCEESPSHNVVFRALYYGFVTLPRDIGVALLVGVVIAGALAVLVPEDELKPYLGYGLPSILLMMLIGVPIYVCATASVPIAAGFIHMGASPGAALAFLIAGPATNAATFTTIWKLLGRRTAGLYLATVAISAIVGGVLLDWFVPSVEAIIPELGSHEHTPDGAGWMTHAWAVALLLVMVLSSRVMAGKHRHEPEAEEDAVAPVSPGRQRIELSITGMKCSHCAESIHRALAECDGVSSAEVDLSGGRATVTGDHLDTGQLSAAVTGLGYEVSLAE